MKSEVGHSGAGSLHVIVTCTNRKSRPVPASLRLGGVTGSDLGTRFREWIRRIDTDQSPVTAARDLYAGEHWMIARGLPGCIAGTPVRLWTCSAGYGLIPADAPVRPYAATFAAGHRDSVPGGADGANEWWLALSTWKGPSARQSRSISQLARAEPAASILLVLSAPYLHACKEDITAAIGLVRDPDRIMVVSAGVRNPGPLGDLMVPADARLQAFLGGTRQALNVRIAAHLLSQGILSKDAAVRNLTSLLAEQPPIPRYERKKLTDAEVLALVKDALSRSPGASASRLLRQFRDAGYACEQARFSRLHKLFTEN